MYGGGGGGARVSGGWNKEAAENHDVLLNHFELGSNNSRPKTITKMLKDKFHSSFTMRSF